MFARDGGGGMRPACRHSLCSAWGLFTARHGRWQEFGEKWWSPCAPGLCFVPGAQVAKSGGVSSRKAWGLWASLGFLGT